jgi:DNA-binding HxlR family transcriptional regulator
MAALDLMGRRWMLRILWELRAGALGARALRERCDSMSSSVLYERLNELQTARLVRQDEHGEYSLTTLGRQLGDAIAPLQRWADKWASAQRSSRSG